MLEDKAKTDKEGMQVMKIRDFKRLWIRHFRGATIGAEGGALVHLWYD